MCTVYYVCLLIFVRCCEKGDEKPEVRFLKVLRQLIPCLLLEEVTKMFVNILLRM